MDGRYEIRVAGSGGQGVILAAVIIGQAAALIEEGLSSVQTQAYGPEARGGASKSEVVLSRSEIDYPKAASPDLMCVLTQKSCDEYARDAREGGIIIVDETLVHEVPETGASVIRVPIVRTAREVIKKELTTNMVALGTIAAVLEAKGVMKAASVRSTIAVSVPKGSEELNGRAFDAGLALMEGKL